MCLEPLQGHRKLKTLTCGHVLHVDCADMCFSTLARERRDGTIQPPQCPVCKAEQPEPTAAEDEETSAAPRAVGLARSYSEGLADRAGVPLEVSPNY